jgi:hypothetical protein
MPLFRGAIKPERLHANLPVTKSILVLVVESNSEVELLTFEARILE